MQSFINNLLIIEKKFSIITLHTAFGNGDFLEHYFTNNENLKSKLRTIEYKYGSFSLFFNSDNGVFSKDKIDYGSKLLVETLLKNSSKKNISILDVGCGYGFMGITLSKVLSSKVTLVDVNKRALHLVEMNLKKNKIDGIVIESDLYQNVNEEYDLIITNPPIRAGKDIVLGILDKAKDYLVDDGELWFVIRKNQGAKSTISHIEINYMVEIIEKSKGFYIIKAKKR